MIKDFDVFSDHTQIYAKAAYELALRHRHATIEESHLLLAVLENPDGLLSKIFNHLSLDVEKLKTETATVMKLQKRVPFWKGRNYQFFTTPTVKHSMEDSVSLSKNLGEDKVISAYIFWGIINAALKSGESQSSIAKVLHDNNITAEMTFEAIKTLSVDN